MRVPDEETFLVRMGALLREMRERAGLSREELARRMNERAEIEPNREIGEILRGFRQRSGLSLEEVVRRMGKEPSACREFESWERDESEGSFYDLVLYMEVVGATFDELVAEWEAKQGGVH